MPLGQHFHEIKKYVSRNVFIFKRQKTNKYIFGSIDFIMFSVFSRCDVNNFLKTKLNFKEIHCKKCSLHGKLRILEKIDSDIKRKYEFPGPLNAK